MNEHTHETRPPTIELSICADCLIWQANGDDTGLSDAPDMSAHNDAVRSAPYVIVVGDDLGFSRASCDVCGDHHGGDRYSAVQP